MNLDRLGSITSELTSSLVKSIVLPSGVLDWLTKPLSDRLRDKKLLGSGEMKTTEALESSRVPALQGPLALFGGLPAPDEAIVALIHLLGGRTAKLAVIPAAALDKAQAAAEGQRLFTRFGMKNIVVFPDFTRDMADLEEWNETLAGFDAVFICGEDPSIGLQSLEGTLAARTLLEMNGAGKLIAGIAGGAAALADYLILQQNGQEELVKGLGLAAGLLIETDFAQQGRFSRLAKVLNAQTSTSLMGTGLDAGAALVIRAGEAKVLGETSVTFLDPRDVTAGADQANGAMPGLKVHVLMAGFGMNMRSRKPSGPPRESPQAASDR